MVRALSIAQAKEELRHVHDISYGDNDISLYRRLNKQWYYCLEMIKEVDELQSTF